MIRTLLAAVALLLATTTMNAQQSINLDLNVKSTNKVPTTKIAKGAEFTINSVTCDMSNRKGFNYILGITAADGQMRQIDLSKAHQMPISFIATNKDDYWYARSVEYSLPSLASMIVSLLAVIMCFKAKNSDRVQNNVANVDEQ